MKKNLTELVFILDRSGSMSGLEKDTIGGFNSMLSKQKEIEGQANITTILFDNDYELLHDHISIRGVKPITKKDYYVRGTTALLDAVGKTIHKMISIQRNTTKEQQAEKVIFVITTDGMENASCEYNYNEIKRMIQKQKKNYDWEFIFLGANIDAEVEGERFGIDRDRSARFHNDTEGVELNYTAVSNAINDLRGNKEISEDWKFTIDQDYMKRK